MLDALINITLILDLKSSFHCDFYLIAGTSKESMHPLQKAVDSATGFLWDDDMGDELLKLLIAKAKLFEAQIRYASNGAIRGH